MGQYFKLVNYDKKQRYNPSDTTFAIKWYGFSRNFTNSVAMINLLVHEWNGDRIAIVGDYGNEHDYAGDHLQDIPGDEARYIVERNIDKKFVRSEHGWYELPESLSPPRYSGFNSVNEYVFGNYDKKQYMRFDAFPDQGSTYRDLINDAHSTGAYFAMCNLLVPDFSYGSEYDSWSGDRVGIILKNGKNAVDMKDITEDILQEPEIASFYYEEDEW